MNYYQIYLKKKLKDLAVKATAVDRNAYISEVGV